MRIRLLGGFAVEHDGAPVDVAGAMQRGLLFRLALDPGAQVGYRALAEDLWPLDPPENTRAALQSLASRLRTQVPAGVLESGPGGYRLAVDRDEVDAVRFQDLVAAAKAAPADEAPALAQAALDLWGGPPWTPGDGYDWFERDLGRDRDAAVELGGARAPEADAAVPVALTAFIGRDEELAAVAGQLARGRLVTILGPGGAGKTRLAMEASREHRHPVIVELAPAGPDELWQAILGAVGRDLRIAVEANVAAPLERATASLSGRDVLLLLDNCEHLIDAAAVAVHELLQALPRLRILTTSREPLGVAGEAFVPLGPLAPEAAERLFADRVLAARGAALEPGEGEDAARIRRRLDGLPLALELAAAKARTMTVAEIANGLDDRFSLLTGGLRTVLPRHQTLRALVDWSWSLLDDDERRMLMVLAIYPAGVAAADAAAVAGAHGGHRSTFDALVDKSLLQRTGGRYRALETIREYGIERLGESGRLDEERLAQARWLAAAAADHDRRLRTAEIHKAIAWFDAEDDNLAGALRFTAEHECAQELVEIAGDCAWYWIIRDRNDDNEFWLKTATPLVDRAHGWQAAFIRAAAMMVATFDRGDQTRSVEFPNQTRERTFPTEAELAPLRREAEGSDHDIVQLIPVLLEAFAAAFGRENWMLTVQVPDAETLDVNPWSRAILTVARAAMAQNRGDVADLGSASERAVELFTETGDLWGLALARQMRAEWLKLAGRTEEALALTDQSTLDMARITSSWDLLQQQGLAVDLLQRLGRVDEARARAEGLLEQARETDSGRAIVLGCCVAGFLAVEVGDVEWATALVAELDDNLADWGDIPPQVHALVGMLRGSVAVIAGDLARAETELRAAAEGAVASHDYPVMGDVALRIAVASLAAGRYDEAEIAISLSDALRGTPDLHSPVNLRVRAALAAARPASASGGTAEAGRAVDREEAARELAQILRR